MKKGSQLDKCRKGYHDMTDDNVYVNPTTGQRTCKQCLSDRRKRNYKPTMPEKSPALYLPRDLFVRLATKSGMTDIDFQVLLERAVTAYLDE